MSNLFIQAIEKSFINKKVPVLRPGYQVRVHQKIKEGDKERVQIFEGMVLSLSSGQGASRSVTVRKVVGGIGVEKIFPLYSPGIAKIEIKKTFKVRRAKLNYLTRKEGLSKRLSAKLGLIEKDETHKKMRGLHEEEVVETPAEEVAPESEVAPKAQETAPAEEAAAEVAEEAPALSDAQQTSLPVQEDAAPTTDAPAEEKKE